MARLSRCAHEPLQDMGACLDRPVPYENLESVLGRHKSKVSHWLGRKEDDEHRSKDQCYL